MQYHSLKQSASSNRVRQMLKLLHSKKIFNMDTSLSTEQGFDLGPHHWPSLNLCITIRQA